MSKDHKSLLEMLMTEDQNQSERSLEMWNEDPYPPDRIETLLGDSHRSAVINFIHSFQWRVEQGHAIPNHWLKFLAGLLGKAVDAVESGDKRARNNPLAEAMNLSGRSNFHVRNELIASQVRRYFRQGKKLDDAVDRVHEELINRKIGLSKSTVHDIYKARTTVVDNTVEGTLNIRKMDFLDTLRG